MQEARRKKQDTGKNNGVRYYLIGSSILLFMFLIVGVSGCDVSTDEMINSKTVCSDSKILVSVESDSYQKNFCVELADDNTERNKGLMYRQSLPENEGMLFVYPEPQKVSFWMKNTLISLDLLFFDENNQLVEIKDNFQPCTEIICESYVSKNKVKYVLEVNADQFVKNDVEKKMKLQIE